MTQLVSPDARAQIGKRLARVRREANMSQADMAQALGVSCRTYQSFEQGLREVQSGVLPVLRRMFNVDPAWIMEGEAAGPKRRPESLVDEATWCAAFRVLDAALTRTGLRLDTAKKLALLRVAYKDLMRSGAINEAELEVLIAAAA